MDAITTLITFAVRNIERLTKNLSESDYRKFIETLIEKLQKMLKENSDS